MNAEDFTYWLDGYLKNKEADAYKLARIRFMLNKLTESVCVNLESGLEKTSVKPASVHSGEITDSTFKVIPKYHTFANGEKMEMSWYNIIKNNSFTTEELKNLRETKERIEEEEKPKQTSWDGIMPAIAEMAAEKAKMDEKVKVAKAIEDEDFQYYPPSDFSSLAQKQP